MQRVATHLRLADRARRDFSRGRFLLAASLAVWLASTSLVWELSLQSGPAALGAAAFGGAVSGTLGALRSVDDPGRTPGWIYYRIASTVAIAAAGFYILSDVWRNDEINSHWMTFFFGALVYTIVRDIIQTAYSATRAQAITRELEAQRNAQRDRVLALATSRAAKANDLTALVYSSRSPVTTAGPDEH